MPKIIRIPPAAVIPPRTRRRDFVEEMFYLYRMAGSPALHEVETWIKANQELRGTASTETIRRVLRGHVPPKWHTVEAITLAFCTLAGVDPNHERHPDDINGSFSYLDSARRAWTDAIDEEPRTAPAPPATNDPWSDEPPF